MMKFYHASVFEALEERAINYKILSSISKKSQYIFEDMGDTKIKELCSTVKDNLCFLIKDNENTLFYKKTPQGITKK